MISVTSVESAPLEDLRSSGNAGSGLALMTLILMNFK